MDFNFNAILEGDQLPEPATDTARPGELTIFNQEKAIIQLRKGLQQYDQDIDDMVEDAKSIDVLDLSASKIATALAGKAKKVARAVTALAKEYYGPHDEFVKALKAVEKSFTGRLKEVEAIAKEKIVQNDALLRIERQKQEQAAQKAAKEIQDRLDAEAEAAGVPTVELNVQVTGPATPRVTRTDEGSLHFTTKKRFRVIDLSQIPTEYLITSPDMAKIEMAMNNGILNIPGIEFYEDRIPVIRS